MVKRELWAYCTITTAFLSTTPLFAVHYSWNSGYFEILKIYSQCLQELLKMNAMNACKGQAPLAEERLKTIWSQVRVYLQNILNMISISTEPTCNIMNISAYISAYISQWLRTENNVQMEMCESDKRELFRLFKWIIHLVECVQNRCVYLCLFVFSIARWQMMQPFPRNWWRESHYL